MLSLQIVTLFVTLSVGANALWTNMTRYNNMYAEAAYTLVDTYNSTNFYTTQNFTTGADPTHGFVKYLSLSAAVNLGIVSTANSQVYLGVDWTTANTVNGRSSIRTSSKKAYTHGLFIGDIAHMPDSICGVWPSWWLFGPNWPNNGEIDIIEGVSKNTQNTITLHTSASCSANIKGSQAGTKLLESNCNAKNGNDGCGVSTTNPNDYGTGFNSIGGGVYAMQWESTGIYVWFFPRSSIPSDITASKPKPAGWGTPIVAYNNGTNCNIDSHFANANIIFDTTFCGDWAASVWSTGSCAGLADTCAHYVQNNPKAFQYAHWLINSVKVYQLA